MSGRRLLFGLVLGASVATNGYLLHARGRQRPRTVNASSERPEEIAAPLPSTDARLPASSARGSGKLDRAALEARVRAAEAKLEALRPMSEKFDRATGGPENEARVRKALEPVFGRDGSAYELECRGDICRLTTDRPPREWQESIQEDMLDVARDMSFSDAVYFHVGGTRRPPGEQYVFDVADALQRSPAFAACKLGETQMGTVIVHLQLIARHVEVSVTGPLAQAPVGTCIQRVVENIVRATPVPDDLTSLPINDLPVPVP